MFNNLKIKIKILILSLIGLLGLTIVSVATIIGLNKIGSEIDEIAEYIVPLNTAITDLEKSILEEESLTFQLILSIKEKDLKEFKSLEKEVDSLVEEADELFEKAKELTNSALKHGSEQTIPKYNKFLETIEQIKNKQNEFKITLKKFEQDIENRNLKDFKKELNLFKSELKFMEKNITKMMRDMEDLLKNVTSSVEKHEHKLLTIILVTAGTIFLLIAILSYVMITNIKKSFISFEAGINSFFNYLNRKSSEVKPLDDSSKDEFGVMAVTINESIHRIKNELDQDRKVIDDTIEVLAEFEKGDLCQRVTSKTSNPALFELTSLLNKMGDNIEINIDRILDVLEKYSKNNYLDRVETNGIKEHLLKLANGINILGEVITKGLVLNKQNGLTLEHSANILKENVENLSISSNEAAASLEETAAALDEITGNVVSSSENVSSMAKYASKVSSSVSSGQTQANNTMEAMDQINEEVHKINDAITVIDQISFQTNILSLNAAVEAATAGEAGKGFAVVAGEVRNLANRSAEAAKEIKAIVELATVKANNGKEIAENMLNGYVHLNTDIEKTIELINNVDVSSKEQQLAIKQINDAINQLDEQTQKNSAAAMQTNDIALHTQELSKTIIKEVDSKMFEGKDNVIREDIKQSEKSKLVLNDKLEIKENRNNDESEWESF